MTRCGAAMALGAVSVSGCFLERTSQVVHEASSEPIVLVVQDVYGRLAEPASIYLGGDESLDPTLARVRTELATELPPEFHSPEDRIDGAPGASIALGRFRTLDAGRVQVVASFVTEDTGERGCVEYTLDADGDGWRITETVDVWPDCPISAFGDESYHDAVTRARGDKCARLGTGIGMCGPWLYVLESSGYDGARSYFDQLTGLIVAKEMFNDTGEVSDHFVFGHVDCQPIVTESVPCGDRVKEACEAVGGVWRIWSRLDAALDRPSCNLRASDAGKQCENSTDCEGECFPEPTPTGACVVGVCSEFQRVFGCFAYLDSGVCGEICVD